MALNYGFLSCASIVPRFVHALAEVPGAAAYAIAGRDLARAEALAEELHIAHAYGSYEELLADPQVDVVYVAMINSLHYEWARAALEAGKHVIVEKPMCLTLADAASLFDLAAAKGLFIAEAQKSAFLPVYDDVAQLVASGELGQVRMLDFSSSCAPSYNGWLHSAEAGGGALYGNAGYCISIIQRLFGGVQAYSGLATYGDSEVEEQCVLNFNIGGEILAVSRISTNLLTENQLVIWADKGHIVIPDYWKARTATVYTEGEGRVIEHPCTYELSYEARHFNECIEAGQLTSPVLTRERTLETVGIMEDLVNHWRKKD